MAVALSQFVTATGASVSSVSVVFSSAVGAGNTLVVLSGYFSNGNTIFSTLVDNLNTAGFVSRVFSTMSNAADTNAHLLIHDKLNISSGGAASTYRVEMRVTGTVTLAGLSFVATEWSGGPFAVGSTISANGTSSGPVAGALTASSTPALFISGGIHNSTTTFASTATGGSLYITTADPTNANQVVNVVYDKANSSLQKNIGHSLATSTRWLAASVVYTGQGAAGAAAFIPQWFTMMGVQ